MNATERRDHIRAMLADLRLPGALEAVDEILADVDRGSLHASQAIERLLSPGGHFKLPHPWPGQNPPLDSSGTGR